MIMLSYEVRRSTTINRSCSDIFQYLSHFEHWPEWSPWLILEPSCPVQFQGTQGQPDSGYSWDGDMVGAGSMTLIEADSNRLEMTLQFLRPFKSNAQVRFEILQDGDHCIVTWVMESKVPWYLFFMKNMMKNWIAIDYDRGLLMLKSQLETGRILSSLQIIGGQDQPQLHYLALKGRATTTELGDVMQTHFVKLNAFIQENNLATVAPPFALYESMDMATTESEFFTCFVLAKPIDPPPPFVCDCLEACETFVVQHKGAYRFIGNAWSLAMTASRHQNVNIQRKPMGIERYLNNPDDVNEQDLLCEIVLFKS
jgi:DNA gyrase inhibitor GyrI